MLSELLYGRKHWCCSAAAGPGSTELEQTEQALARHPAVTALEHGGILYYQQILYSLFLYCPLIFLPYLINIYNLVKKRSFFCNKNIHPCCTGEFIRWWAMKLAAHSLLFALFTPEILFMVSSLLWLLQWKHDLIPAPRTHSGIYLHRYLSRYLFHLHWNPHYLRTADVGSGFGYIPSFSWHLSIPATSNKYWLSLVKILKLRGGETG